jgi:hypothetical protein
MALTLDTLPSPRRTQKTDRWIALRIPIVLLGLIGLLSVHAPLAKCNDPNAPDLNFGRDIRPILSDKCFHCHGPDEANRQGGLRLDVRQSAVSASESGNTAIVPNDAIRSEVVNRIFSTDANLVMPPPDSQKTLSTEEKNRIRQWINQGAGYEEHWAFRTPQRSEPPSLAAEDLARSPNWDRNPIDRFLLHRMRMENLAPNPAADKETLLRRVALDLTGLPPTQEERTLFLNDTSPNAYESMVDRLLASPHYGERMAIQWLDFARYADSNGYQSDGSRDIWGWRDWVINAYNQNMPFDQFTIEQLAGDMLPGATPSQIIATGFNRNHRLNGEGGRIEAEWFVETVIDRVETTGLTWLGLTLNCCRCHDHKYDPISQKEFYQFFAYFNSVEESGVLAPVGKNSENTPPLFSMRTESHEKEVDRREKEIAQLEDQIRQLERELPALTKDWATKTQALLEKGETVSQWSLADVVSAKSEGGASLQSIGDGSYLASGKNPPNDIYQIEINRPNTSVAGVLLEVFPDASLPGQSLGRGFNGNFVLTDFEVYWKSQPNRKLAISRTEADFSQDQWPASELVKNKKAGTGPKNRRGWAIEGNNPEKRIPRKLVIQFSKQEIAPEGDSLVIRFGNSSTYADHNVGKFRLSLALGADPSTLQLASPSFPDDVLRALRESIDKWSESDRTIVEQYYRKQASNPIRELESKKETKKKELASYLEDIPTTMVMKEAKPRDAYVLLRGEYDKPAAKVERRTPAVLPPLPEGTSNDRLGLAKWIAHPNNPLTARVWVNREWERFFGIGIVKTSENLGSQSEYPVHPELLDWLAVEFMSPRALPNVHGKPAHPWDMKGLQKLILMSQAYRQSSRLEDAKLEKDPDNRYLSRGPRFRLTGEIIRDCALASSGLLVRKLGGPSVRPYMPAGVWDETSKYGNLRNYQHDKDDGRYRRSLYTIWKRTAAPPTMLLFDAPNREICTVKRSRTNTPLQALALLNEVTFVEAARGLAIELIQSGGSSPDSRIRFGFQQVFGRRPTDTELRVLSAGLEKDLQHFRAHPDQADQLIRFGDSPAPSSIPKEEIAAYTVLANVLYNLDEFVTRE